MELNYLAILLASVAQFAVGAVWYSFLFGKLWGKIHGFDKLPKEVQQKMMQEMGPYYILQAAVTIITSVIFAVLLSSTSENLNSFILALLLWIGLVVPTQVSAVIFGGTESKWLVKKIAVQAGASLLCLQAAAAVFYFMAK